MVELTCMKLVAIFDREIYIVCTRTRRLKCQIRQSLTDMTELDVQNLFKMFNPTIRPFE